ncbi:unnamed protein product [Toxocara canis]|uniref:Transposase n=1 Tax=Toxocara canis TaxID=6265 RepID=A0A183UXY6_TOXCA|nr:unnamed protein product [Toxocara canis]
MIPSSGKHRNQCNYGRLTASGHSQGRAERQKPESLDAQLRNFLRWIPEEWLELADSAALNAGNSVQWNDKQ